MPERDIKMMFLTFKPAIHLHMARPSPPSPPAMRYEDSWSNFGGVIARGKTLNNDGQHQSDGIQILLETYPDSSLWICPQDHFTHMLASLNEPEGAFHF